MYDKQSWRKITGTKTLKTTQTPNVYSSNETTVTKQQLIKYS